MANTPQHLYQILTKRADRMERFMRRLNTTDPRRYLRLPERPLSLDQAPSAPAPDRMGYPPLPNVWLGVSVESQDYLSRTRHLARTPAAVRFLSCEPLLGPLDLDELLWYDDPAAGVLPNNRIHWVIAGGESGPGARPCDLDWLRGLRDQCQEAGVPFFLKQLGAVLGREMGCRDRKGGDMLEWPADLRVREMPR